MRRGTRQLGASPVLIGSVTLLIAIVAVFISYSANNGLPFVPTYKLKAELPNGYKLVKGNEVRAGGFRVGIVKDITSARRNVDGKERAIAVLDLRLDKQIEPLSVDTTLSVRPRSALGLKYVELIPGRSKQTYQDGATIPLSRGKPERARARGRAVHVRAQDARRRPEVARGLRQLDRRPRPRDQHDDPRARAVHALPAARDAQPLEPARPSCATSSRALGAAAAQAAPVAEVQARWFGEMATTFAAISRDPEALRETISESPPTLEAATESFRVQTPFLARFAAVSRDLQPGTALLPHTLPLVNAALRAGVPAFRETPELAGQVEDLFRALEDLGDNPNTLLALRDLRTARARDEAGDQVRRALPDGLQLPRLLLQPARDAPVGRRARRDHRAHPREAGRHPAAELARVDGVHPPGRRARAGRTRRRSPPSRCFTPSTAARRWTAAGARTARPARRAIRSGSRRNPRYPGGHLVVDPNTPGLAGGTFKARQLGIKSLKDVP